MSELAEFIHHPTDEEPWPAVVIGGSAAGLMAAIAAGRRGCRVLVLDGAARLGAKILISGGGRCNVTNAEVRAADFNGGPRRTIARVLEAWPVASTVRFFEEAGVRLHEEPRGKLFPDTNRARTVLDALLDAARAAHVTIRPASRVLAVERRDTGFTIRLAEGTVRARTVVLATGGLSVPKTGSDGAGHAFAARLGHRIVPTTPALVPLLLGEGFHAAVSGASLDVACELRNDGRLAARTTGPLLWTHAGVSGPAALDLSRHWHRAVEGGQAAAVQVNLRPGLDVGAIDHQLAADTIQRPRVLVTTVLASWVPASLAPHVAAAAGLPAGRTLAHLRREDRRRLAHALGALPLDVRGSRGYAVAEATAGGVALEDVDPATLQSRRCPGLFLAGEILDVDGRLGGFNFQWAWASGMVAGRGVVRGAGL